MSRENKGLGMGARVKLSAATRWEIGPANPAIGTMWECVGTIDYVDEDPSEYGVQWDNGNHNGSYTNADLLPAITPYQLPEELFEL